MKLMPSLLLLFIFSSIKAQDTLNSVNETSLKSYRVEWVDQFPLLEAKESNKGWLTKFLLGNKTQPDLIKPLSIIALNPKSYLVLDQGTGTIFQVNNGKKRNLKVFKKNKFDFASLVSFCRFKDKFILFTDSRLNKIFRINEEQNNIDIFNKKLQLQKPTGIAYSNITNEIWVIETDAHRISILNEQGQLIKTIGKRGIKPGEFNFPTSLCIDKSGNAYVIDAMNFRIQVFSKTGEVISVFGEPGNATGYLARPKGIAIDQERNIYITDALYHTVQVFDINGNFLYHFGNQGRGKNQFWMPFGIYIDKNNYIYVADSYNARIQILKLLENI